MINRNDRRYKSGYGKNFLSVYELLEAAAKVAVPMPILRESFLDIAKHAYDTVLLERQVEFDSKDREGPIETTEKDILDQ